MSDNEELVNTAVVADWLDCTERRVRQLVEDGVVFADRLGKLYRFNLRDSVRAYVSYLREGAKEDDTKSVEKRKLVAEAEFREMKVAQERLKLAELENNMHRSDDVQEAFEQLVYTTRSMLLALPGRLAVDVADVDSAAEASALIRDEVYAILNELSNFQYDPDFFAHKVNEREGWSGDDATEESEG